MLTSIGEMFATVFGKDIPLPATGLQTRPSLSAKCSRDYRERWFRINRISISSDIVRNSFAILRLRFCTSRTLLFMMDQ